MIQIGFGLTSKASGSSKKSKSILPTLTLLPPKSGEQKTTYKSVLTDALYDLMFSDVEGKVKIYTAADVDSNGNPTALYLLSANQVANAMEAAGEENEAAQFYKSAINVNKNKSVSSKPLQEAIRPVVAPEDTDFTQEIVLLVGEPVDISDGAGILGFPIRKVLSPEEAQKLEESMANAANKAAKKVFSLQSQPASVTQLEEEEEEEGDEEEDHSDLVDTSLFE